MSARPLPTLAVCFLLAALPALANDWPQWRGPDRSDVSKETGLLKSWPAGGPKLLWTSAEAGIGYSGPAVVGDRLYFMGAEGDKEYLYAFNTDGKKIWSLEIGPIYKEGHGNGPRGTPTVDGDSLYVIGGRGNLVCATRDGKKHWSVSLTADLKGGIPYWGYTESPLVDGGHVVCTPGGSQGTLAKLDKKTGEVVWRSKGLTDSAAYSSVIVAELPGARQYVQVTGGGVAGVATEDGRALWHGDKSWRKTAMIPTPIFHDGCVYVSTGYGNGCALFKLTPAGDGGCKADTVYANKNMVNHHGGVILVGDDLYGYSDGKGWVCQDFKTGDIKWAEKKLGKGSVTCADGRLYCFSEDGGRVVLVEANPKGWVEAGRFTIPRETSISRGSGKIWTHPVVANGRLYLRDQDLLFCFDIKAGS